ncbi:hypothetical protein [Actinomadura macrotermitis]|uniref:Uncharacterized protein n=1 Tax=Actinomadura macrotermitis TaxID=2585200 RepID=A0A7K0BT06_9ACTN|nr:hypothetical protein [Actinomadura macrotermitis]MQY04328.1 hypothetical protein [Actinomadura macrotermitis]
MGLWDSCVPDDSQIVFARGLPLAGLIQHIREVNREVICSGEANGWAWVVHPMANPEADDWDMAGHLPASRGGVEVVEFVTDPCSAKAHAPQFSYARDGRWILHFSLDDVEQRVGDNPDYLSPELLAAGVIGPDAWNEDDDDEAYERAEEDIVRVITAFFQLPSPPLSTTVEAAP